MLKNSIQFVLRRFGYYLRSTRRFGENYWSDLVTLSGSASGSPCVFFDVGAHHGETLDAVLDHFSKARLHCFEPDPESFSILSAKATGNPRVKIHHFALGAAPGAAEFHRNSDSLTNSLLPTSQESLQSDNSAMTSTREVVNVPIETLDSVCEREGIDRIDVLKTDCQGYDLKVLEGASRMVTAHKIKVITCEVIFDDEYDGQGRFHELMAFLDLRGYRFMGFYNMARNRKQECTFCDAVFRLPIASH